MGLEDCMSLLPFFIKGEEEEEEERSIIWCKNTENSSGSAGDEAEEQLVPPCMLLAILLAYRDQRSEIKDEKRKAVVLCWLIFQSILQNPSKKNSLPTWKKKKVTLLI